MWCSGLHLWWEEMPATVLLAKALPLAVRAEGSASYARTGEVPRQRSEPSALEDAQDEGSKKFTTGKGKPRRSHTPGSISPNPALSAPTHPREGLPGVNVGPAPRLRGLLQLPLPPPPPPSRRCALSPFRCSAGCHRRAEPGRRRAVPGLGVRCPAAPGPPPCRGRPFSTADSGQPAAWSAGLCPPVSGQRSA